MAAWWTSPRKRRKQAEFLAGLEPVMLMGRGHSGTRVLSFACMHLGIQLGTSAATGDADNRTFTRTIKKIAAGNLAQGAPQAVRERDLIRFQDAVYTYYTTLGSPQAHWGWKFPETYLIGDCIARTFPRARYIHLVRDGRDLAFKKHLTDDPNRVLGRRLLTHIDAMDEPHHLQAALSWAFQVDRFDEFRRALNPERVLDMRFEDVCRDPMSAMQSMCDFLGIPMTEACESYITGQLDTAKIAQHTSEDPAKIREIETRIGDTLKRYRYL
jgi:hypothetical protein